MNIVGLMIRKPEYLTDDEIVFLRDYYEKAEFDGVYEIAKKNKILPFAAHVFTRLDIDNDKWSKVHEKYEKRNQKVIKSIDEVFSRMESGGITSLCALENFAVMLSSDECRGCFCSGDVDLTADTAEREEIEKILSECGYQHVTRRNSMDDIMSNYFNPSIIKNGFYINLMWVPIARLHLFNQDEITARLERERHQTIKVGNTLIRTLKTTELMYYCIIHAASSHFYTLTPGIRLYTDIDRLQKKCEIEWKNISKWAVEDNLGIRTDILLTIYSKVMNTKIPDEAFTSGKGSKYFNKLMNYLYDEKTKEFKKHQMRAQKFYAEMLSDNHSVIVSMVKRLK